MPKKKDEKVETITYGESDDLMMEARLRGRNDLIQTKGGKAIKIEGPYGRASGAMVPGVGEAEGPSGDDTNTPSPGSPGGRAAGTNQ